MSKDNKGQPVPGGADRRRSPADEASSGAPQTAENICRTCHGTGRVEGRPCPECGGSGKVIETVGDA